MVRVIDHREDASPTDIVFELKVYLSHKDAHTILGYLRPNAQVMDRDRSVFIGTDFGIPVKEAFMTAIDLCQKYAVPSLWIDDPSEFFPAHVRPNQQTS